MIDSLLRVKALASITILDGIKKNAFVGILLFAMAGQFSGMLFLDFIPRDIGRAVCDLIFSVSFLAGFIFILFHAVQVMTWSDQNRIIHTFLARPISRAEYLLGNFTGLAVLLIFLNILMLGLGWFVLHTIKDNVGHSYFPFLSSNHYFLAFFALYLMELILLSVVAFFSSIIRGSFPVMLLTLAYYFICTGLPVVRESVMQTYKSEDAGMAASFFQVLNGIFPDFSRLDFKTLVIEKTAVLTISDHLLTLIVSSLYIIVLLWFAALAFKKQDIL